MSFLTNEKLVIVGAGGMIGSNMAQSVLTLGLTPNVCLYDIFEPGLHGVANEIAQCGFQVRTLLGQLTLKKHSQVLNISSLPVVHHAKRV